MEPIQFISTGSQGNEFVLNEECIKILDEERRPVTVICIVGPYRTGKSYLLNRIMGKADGFPLGPTLQAKTKGIWMWVGDFLDDPHRALILLDTEGLNDPEKGDAGHDSNMFALSLLLSSVFIFNSLGTIDAKSLDGLHFATELSQFITADSSNKSLNEGQDFAQHFPSFIWAIRDHHLKLLIDDKVVSTNEYLEHCLKPKRGHGSKIIEYNGLRDTLRAFFPERSCFVFPRPVDNQALMNHLENVSEHDLNPGFIQAGDQFLSFIKTSSRPKKIKGSPLTGRSFGSLVKTYIKAVLEKNICIESTYQYVISQENEKAIKDALKEFNDRMSFLSEMFPVALEAFTQQASDAQASATKVFLSGAVNIEKHKEFQTKLEDLFTEIVVKFNQKNNQASELKCKKIMMSFFDPVKERAKAGEFMVPGGFKILKEAIEDVEMNYQMARNKEEMGPQLSAVFVQFQQDEFKPLLEGTLQADKQLEIGAKKLELEKLERYRQEELTKHREEELKSAQQQMEDLEAAHKESMNQFKTKIEAEQMAQIEDLRRQMDNDKKEMQKNYDAGKVEAARMYQSQIDALKNQMSAHQNRSTEVHNHYHTAAPPPKSSCVIS